LAVAALGRPRHIKKIFSTTTGQADAGRTSPHHLPARRAIVLGDISNERRKEESKIMNRYLRSVARILTVAGVVTGALAGAGAPSGALAGPMKVGIPGVVSAQTTTEQQKHNVGKAVCQAKNRFKKGCK
jgi:hypothetical protein